MGREATAIWVRIARRVLVEWLIWLPVTIILTHSFDLSGKLFVSCGVIGSFALGMLLYKLPPVRSKVILFAVSVIVLGIGIIFFRNDWMAFALLGVLLWRGRYLQLLPRQYGFAFVLCCVAVIVAAQSDILPDYRILFIGLSLIWIVAWFLSLNRGLLTDAALQNSILTRPVRLASRRYLLIFLAAAFLIFAVTVNYGEQLLTPPVYVPGENNVEIPEVQPPLQNQPSLKDMLGVNEEQGEPSKIWEIVFWIMSGLAAIGFFFFVKMLWRDRTWTWQRLLSAIRMWFLREKKTEALPYIEERRSLMKEKKRSSRWNAFFQKNNREQEWDQLDNPQKVRLLYEAAVLSGIDQGYEFKVHHTSSETLEGMAHWRKGLALRDKEKESKSSYWIRLMNIRLMLIKLYDKARYSPHSVTDQEVKDLKERLEND